MVRINDIDYDNLKVNVSLSHCKDTAVAFVVAMEIKNE